MKISIIGLGVTGFGLLKYLINKNEDEIFVSDSAESLSEDKIAFLKKHGVNYELGGNTEEILNHCNIVLIGPGVNLQNPILSIARMKNVKIMNDIEFMFREFKDEFKRHVKLVGVTGTNGKTTTTTLIGEVLKKAGYKTFVGGNIGNAFSNLSSVINNVDVIVLELSSFQLELVDEFHADIGIILNITPDHIDRHGTMKDYVTSKSKLFGKDENVGTAILNFNNKWTRNLGITMHRKVRWFSKMGVQENGAFIRNNRIFIANSGIEKEVLPISMMKLKGMHNVENVMAAALVTDELNIDMEIFRNVVNNFSALPHRMEEIEKFDDVLFIDDSKATNTDATLCSFKTYPEGKIVLILGGRAKGEDYSLLLKEASKYCKYVILMGETKKKFAEYLDRIGMNNFKIVNSMKDAVRSGFTLANRGDVVLLSPATASYDMFKNYKERGDAFKEEVYSLKKNHG